MTPSASQDALFVVHRFQARLREYEPGSDAAEIAEHAITLALSDARPAKNVEYLFGDALRDSRRTFFRARRRRRSTEAEVARLAGENIATGGCSGFSDLDTPESLVIASEFESLLKAEAERMGGAAPRVVDGLFQDESELETAVACGVSRSTVSRIRKALRAYATAQGLAPAKAA